MCSDSLEIHDEEGSFYDDVELICSHHLHYDCARELHGQSMHLRCPICEKSLLTDGKLLVTIRNEGGTTLEYDLGTDLEEQTGSPQDALNEAFLSFCFDSDMDAIKEVLADGADINALQRNTGMTGLHLCALNNDAQSIEYLLGKGADRTITAAGTTPLNLAISEGSHEAAYALQ